MSMETAVVIVSSIGVQTVAFVFWFGRMAQSVKALQDTVSKLMSRDVYEVAHAALVERVAKLERICEESGRG